MIAAARHDMEMVIPPLSMLGQKKKPADMAALWQFVEQQYKSCDAAILSGEMMFYGGLLPSRLHNKAEHEKEWLLEKIRGLRNSNPSAKLYMFQLIMRTPRYDSSEEEPDYYEEFGEMIFKQAYYLDKSERVGLTDDEKADHSAILKKIPPVHLHDYENRRAYNLDINLKILSLVEEGVIDLLYIPQDDSCEFGYTAKDQKIVSQCIARLRLQRRVLLYPGADEAGCTLLAKAIATLQHWTIRVYPFYASTHGPENIPNYEDRPMAESLKSHCMAAGVRLVNHKEQADFILAINSPGKDMGESFDQQEKDITYSAWRNLNWFVSELAWDIQEGRKVILADCAYSNGGDRELITLLDDYEILDQLISYKGWNTHCNTLGTSIAQGVLAYRAKDWDRQRKENIIYHLLDDGFYQSQVRQEIHEQFESQGITYHDVKDMKEQIEEAEGKRLVQLYQEEILHSFTDMELVTCKAANPWNRMFEIDLTLYVKPNRREQA